MNTISARPAEPHKDATCADCWRPVRDPVTFTDVDGSTLTVCRIHTLSALELLDALGA